MSAPPTPTFHDFGLSPLLLGAIERAGFVTPTPIQALSIRPALAGRDLLARAPTGTGKTLAFTLPTLERLLRASEAARVGVRVLALAPTRELALQIRGVAEEFGSAVGIRTAAFVGGIPLRTDWKEMQRGPQFVIGTPGRICDHIEHRNLDLSRVAVLVLDEADRMLDLGFMPQVRKILEAVPAARQTLLFSATIPTEIENLSARYLRNPLPLSVGAPTATAAGADQQVLFSPIEHKLPCLIALLREEPGTCLVFVPTKAQADLLHRQVVQGGVPAAALHGDLTQTMRMKALEQFQKEHVRVLIATDVAGRGLDIEGIAHVVNYDVPTDPNDYIHRVGRTGRAEARGRASTLCAYHEIDALHAIERHLRKPIPRGILPAGIETPSWAATVRRFDESVLGHEGVFAPRGFSVRRRR